MVQERRKSGQRKEMTRIHSAKALEAKWRSCQQRNASEMFYPSRLLRWELLRAYEFCLLSTVSSGHIACFPASAFSRSKAPYCRERIPPLFHWAVRFQRGGLDSLAKQPDPGMFLIAGRCSHRCQHPCPHPQAPTAQLQRLKMRKKSGVGLERM